MSGFPAGEVVDEVVKLSSELSEVVPTIQEQHPEMSGDTAMICALTMEIAFLRCRIRKIEADGA